MGRMNFPQEGNEYESSRRRRVIIDAQKQQQPKPPRDPEQDGQLLGTWAVGLIVVGAAASAALSMVAGAIWLIQQALGS